MLVTHISGPTFNHHEPPTRVQGSGARVGLQVAGFGVGGFGLDRM